MEEEIVVSPERDKLLSLLKGTSIYIGHDSGITHLAALLAVRTVALFKNTHPLKWASLRLDVTVIVDVKPPEVIYERIKERLDGL